MPEPALSGATYTVSASERLLAGRVLLAGSSRERRVGLLAHSSLTDGAGLWITPCEAIHTFGMQFPIDAIFLDKGARVCKISERIAPQRIAFCLRAHSVLEVEAGAARRMDLNLGERLQFALNSECR